ncbi:hypothetical protein IMSAGC008_01505 [Muribaculaceae bacterium]|jgi:hypothetical protein|nr:hypothetical protein IMSAGC008_01505 [Muribaculaceae bacterium]
MFEDSNRTVEIAKHSLYIDFDKECELSGVFDEPDLDNYIDNLNDWD